MDWGSHVRPLRAFFLVENCHLQQEGCEKARFSVGFHGQQKLITSGVQKSFMQLSAGTREPFRPGGVRFSDRHSWTKFRNPAKQWM